jgi:hypothetical protein
VLVVRCVCAFVEDLVKYTKSVLKENVLDGQSCRRCFEEVLPHLLLYRVLLILDASLDSCCYKSDRSYQASANAYQ